MYAKIVTLLAVFLSGLSGYTAVSHHTSGDQERERERTAETVRDHQADDQDHEDEARTHDDYDSNHEGNEPSHDERRSGEEHEEELLGCHTDDGTLNSQVTDFANEYGLTYESVIPWYCAGYAFENIETAYEISVLAGVSLDQIYEMRVVQGMTWDDIILTLGIDYSREEGQPMLLDEIERDHSDE